MTRFRISAHDRVHARQPVVDQHEHDDQQQPDHRRQHAGANRVGAETRPDGAFLEIGQRRRQRAGSQNQREVRDFFLGEAAGDASVARDAPVDSRRRLHAPVEDDGEIAADVLAGHLAEPRGALGVQREADRRPVVLVERRPRAAQIAAGDGRGLAHQVVDRAAARVADAAARAGNDFHPVRRLTVDEQRSFDADGPCSTIFSSRRPVDRMISFARLTSVTPGSCTRI